MTARTTFRIVSLLEGISYVVLLAIAMPLKYIADEPSAVAITGRIHGGLFVLFGLALASVASREKWPRRAIVIAAIAAVVPLAAFWLERKLLASETWPAKSG